MTSVTSVSKKTHYEVLGVDRDSTTQEIKNAYKEKLLSTHPDKTNKQLVDSDIIAQIKLAYATLNNDVLRTRYDDDLNQSFKKSGLLSTGEGLDIVTLDDFEYSEETGFVRDCPRCTAVASFVLTEDDLADSGTADGLGGYEIIVQCNACSLWLKVKYYDLEDDDEGES